MDRTAHADAIIVSFGSSLQALGSQEIRHDIISTRGIVVEVYAVASVRLDVGLEVVGTNIGEILCHSRWDGWNIWVAGGKAVTPAVWQVIRYSTCQRGMPRT